jgi:CRISPR/Cas system-associated exonuclease Cas4 (RecB family)
MKPAGGPYLTASEIGSFIYCPEAWWLRRHGRTPDADAMERLRAGSIAHRRIGRATDRLVATDAIRRLLLIGLIVVALLLFVQGMGVQLAQVPR